VGAWGGLAIGDDKNFRYVQSSGFRVEEELLTLWIEKEMEADVMKAGSRFGQSFAVLQFVRVFLVSCPAPPPIASPHTYITSIIHDIKEVTK